ncbi:phage baseplate assembly protein [Trabulsiella odontotermitis]|uniref:phage baseplate assembly protein n=1 Tax=Trabulsiella odontotermitis TaxID=379893 RepID=UPI000676A31B|nr:phage tail protein [Trabulsiella odontotermitis]KNC92532.1 tail protein [Trabulsiella odontotermitis]
MPTQNEDKDKEKISLVINGKAHSDWTSYSIDSDFLKPADGWQLMLGLPDKAFPKEVVRGAAIKLQVGGETVLSGRIDSVGRVVSRNNYSLSLTGRDDAGILVDCAAPIFSANQLTLDEVIEKIVRPLGIRNIRIQADSAPRNDKVTIEPGMRAWDALAKAAAGRGLWPWMDPDGTLVVGGPDYSAEPVATLVLKNDGKGNNVLELEDRRSINGCFSELTALAQGHARTADSKSKSTAPLPLDIWNDDGSVKLLASDSGQDQNGTTGTNDMSTKVTDPTVDYYRPQIITIGDTNNQEQVDYRAKKEMSDARLSGLDISAKVPGHRTADGVLWEPGQRVRIISEPHGFDEIFFLMGRQFTGGRQGQQTSLRFKEDEVWIPDAFPRDRKRRHRRGGKKKRKNDVAIVRV